MTEREKARVLVSYGGHGVVRLDSGRRLDGKYRRQVGRPVCGDFVDVSHVDAKTAVVEAIHPRRNHFDRADAQGRRHTVAANLDRILVVVAARPLPSRDLLDRYLLAVHDLGVQPVIVFNKSELPLDSTSADTLPLRRLPEYRELGYTVLETSCKGPPGLGGLGQQVHSGTSILVGQSGVGKSSLVRKLLPDLEIQVGELSRVTGKGTHTTTSTTLYDLPQGGHLIDSPGVWEYGLWTMPGERVVEGFREMVPFTPQCRFNNCLHASEPGCGVKAAVTEGQVREWRYQAYLRLLEQNQAPD